MDKSSLDEIYSSLDEKIRTVFVVPLIRYTHQETDYLYLLYKDLIQSDKFDIKAISIFDHFKIVMGALKNKHVLLHYHWLEFQDFKSLLGMPWKMLCIFLFKQFGGKIVWTLHNEFPHDQRYLKLHSFLHRKMAAWADKLHVHCQTAIGIMSERLEVPKEKFFIKAHPEFPATIQPKPEALSNLNEEFGYNLNAGTPILLMFGNISRYKRIEDVARIVKDLPAECTLLIVGPIKKGNMNLYRELNAIQQNSERIIITPSFIKEKHVSWFYNAADICVFNYREILSSGGIHMALSYKKPIISPNKGCISEFKETSNIHLFDDEDELKLLLNRVIKYTDDKA